MHLRTVVMYFDIAWADVVDEEDLRLFLRATRETIGHFGADNLVASEST
jgi:hypothetical protein